MKKLALILALMLIPCTAFGLQMLDENAMDSITGQSGVHIAFDDIQIFLNIEKMAWIDCDGLTTEAQAMNSGQYGTCDGGAGAIGLNNFQIDVLNINAIVSSTWDDGDGSQTIGATGGMELFSVDCGQIPLFYNYGATGTAGCALNVATAQTDGLDNYVSTITAGANLGGFQARALTIDATRAMPAITAGVQNNNGSTSMTFGGIVIGLPTFEIYIQSMSLTPFFTADINGFTNGATEAVVNNNKDFGTIYLEGITFTVLSGWLEIGPH